MRTCYGAFLGSVLMCVTTASQAVTISVTDPTTVVLADTITNAGDYYSSTQETDTSSLLNISNLGASSVNWKIQARTSATGLAISVRRTGGGSGDGTITNGLDYVPLTASYTTLFCGSGTGNHTDIPLQFQIDNLDVSDGYSTNLTPLSLPVDYQIITTTTSQPTCN